MAANDVTDQVLSCPGREELAAFALGKLADRDLERVADHLADCSSCQSILGELAAGDDTSLLHLKRSLREPTFFQDPEYQQMEARARSIQLSGDAPTTPLPRPSDRLPVASQERQAAPTSLGTYQLLEKLGQGGMGAVYKAWHTRLKRHVAVKVLPADRLSDTQAVARFNREMEAVGKLDHPNIIRATDAGDVEGVHFLVMELVDGIDLSELVKRHGPLPLADACELIRQAAVGLQYAHKHGRVHRDIKPSNLMVTPDGQVKVLDLGLALLFGEHLPGEELTGAGMVMGTVDFMAPEQGVDSHQVDIRADIYSLGCTLYKLLSGKVPFGSSRHQTPIQKILAHATDPVPPVRAYRPDLPPGLVAILERMLAKDRSQRYATPGEVAKALQPFAVGSDLSALVATARGEDSRLRQEATDRDLAGALVGTDISVPQGSTLPVAPRTEGQSVPRPPAETQASPLPVAPPVPPPAATGPVRRRVLIGVGIVAGAVTAAALFYAFALPHRPSESPMPKAPEGVAQPGLPTPLLPSSDHPGSLQAEVDDVSPLTNHWTDLLRRPPKLLLWPKDSTISSWQHDPGEKSLRVICQQMGLLELGTTDRPLLAMQTSLLQSGWEGGIGVFYGYHDDEERGPAFKRFQSVTLERETYGGQAKMVLVRNNYFMDETGRLIRQNNVPVMDPHPVPERPVLLEVVVVDSKVSISWGVEQAKAVPDELFLSLRPEDYRGKFGLFVYRASGVFQVLTRKYQKGNDR